jgi:hypothetical protein
MMRKVEFQDSEREEKTDQNSGRNPVEVNLDDTVSICPYAKL